ncbi:MULTISPECIES: hypothetical protein [Pseudarthrobacter]|uniref:ParB family protein n=1 Tax=Pseudarthrobacter TaxID=1742993 RepID=UPI0009D6ABD9|nr:hypothetical protein [Pseudarthrobacter phenanthrenivorans]
MLLSAPELGHTTSLYTPRRQRPRRPGTTAGSQEGYGSIADLIEAAVLREVKRMQRKHNQGRMWEPVPAGALRPGRRTLNEERHRA